MRVRDAIADVGADAHFSAVSAMEIATKFRIGKLPQAALIAGNLMSIALKRNFTPLFASLEHGDLAGSLPHKHRDPFDRLLIAQAMIEQAWLVSNETVFDEFGVRRFW